MHSAPNSVAELRSYSHSTPDVFDEYSGYYGPRKSSMKTFWSEVNKKTSGSPLPDGDGDSLGVCLKKTLDLLRQGIGRETKSNIEEHKSIQQNNDQSNITSSELIFSPWHYLTRTSPTYCFWVKGVRWHWTKLKGLRLRLWRRMRKSLVWAYDLHPPWPN